jgi:transposase
VYVTRRPGEEFDDTCVIEAPPRGPGWLFWGCFSGMAGKGPGIFWEKERGTITSESYCQHIVPIVDGWFRLMAVEGHIFMQDNARPHAAKATREELEERGIPCLQWPPFSPDLKPIENVWNWMKDYIERHFPSKMTYDKLRLAIREAWEAVEERYLDELLDTMPQRCEDCYNADGGPTHW